MADSNLTSLDNIGALEGLAHPRRCRLSRRAGGLNQRLGAIEFARRPYPLLKIS